MFVLVWFSMIYGCLGWFITIPVLSMAPTPARLVTQPGTGPTPKFKHNASLATQTWMGLIWTSTELENIENVWKYLMIPSGNSCQPINVTNNHQYNLINIVWSDASFHSYPIFTNNFSPTCDTLAVTSFTLIVLQSQVTQKWQQLCRKRSYWCPVHSTFSLLISLSWFCLSFTLAGNNSGAVDCETNQMRKKSSDLFTSCRDIVVVPMSIASR